MEDRLQLYQRLKGWIGTMLNVSEKFVHLNGTLPKKRYNFMSIVRNLKLREFQEENFSDLILIRKSNLIKCTVRNLSWTWIWEFLPECDRSILPDSRKSRNYKSKGASTEPCTRLRLWKKKERNFWKKISRKTAKKKWIYASTSCRQTEQKCST